jgi:stearoyl-CoA desaturase (delta-9 desaturase)
MYLLTGLGITVGFHRLITHRSFQTSKPIEYSLAVLVSMAVQGPVIAWGCVTCYLNPHCGKTH